jgi:hypothetical protein
MADIDPGAADGDAPLDGAEPLMQAPASSAPRIPDAAEIFFARVIVGLLKVCQGWPSIFCIRSISVV